MRCAWKKIVFCFVAIGIGCSIWAVVIEPDRLVFRDYDIRIDGWPEELSGFTIALITDTHVGSPHVGLDKLQQVIEQTNARKPEMILLGGDYVIQGVLGGHPVPSADIAKMLAGLHAPHGVFAVLGNHDWWENGPRIRAEFEAQHIPMLEDTAIFIRSGTQGFWLAGISDYTEGAHDIASALAKVKGNQPVIALTHAPDIFPEIPGRVALTLAGHTHGGQVYIPLLGRLVVPSKYGQRYAMGLVTEEGRQLFVSPGIGTSILPVRFMTPPEVSLLHIYPAK